MDAVREKAYINGYIWEIFSMHKKNCSTYGMLCIPLVDPYSSVQYSVYIDILKLFWPVLYQQCRYFLIQYLLIICSTLPVKQNNWIHTNLIYLYVHVNKKEIAVELPPIKDTNLHNLRPSINTAAWQHILKLLNFIQSWCIPNSIEKCNLQRKDSW